MNIQDANIGLEIVRTKGDQVGKTGKIIEIDTVLNRVRTDWDWGLATWSKIETVEPKSIPYEITEYKLDKRTGRQTFPKYIRK